MPGDAHLAGLGRLLGELERGLAAVGEEEALDVVHFRTLDERRDRRGRQVGLLELLRSAERRDEGAGNARSVGPWDVAWAAGEGGKAHRLWPVIMTPQAPVFSPFLTR